MAAIATQRAIPMIVIIIPARESVEALQGRSVAKHLDYDLPARFVRTRLDALRVPFVDLAPLFARHPVDKVFFGHDLHFTPFGHRLVADAVRPLVERIASPTPNATCAGACSSETRSSAPARGPISVIRALLR